MRLQQINSGSNSAFKEYVSVLEQITRATRWFDRILSVVFRLDRVSAAGVPDLRNWDIVFALMNISFRARILPPGLGVDPGLWQPAGLSCVSWRLSAMILTAWSLRDQEHGPRTLTSRQLTSMVRFVFSGTG